MPKFSKKSLEKLEFLDKRLVNVLNEVIKIYDFTIIETFRDEKTQNLYFKSGQSKLKFPQSKHNKLPAIAVDIAPWPINWNDTKNFYFLAGLVISEGKRKGLDIRWGGDWDQDFDFNDQSFNDLVHFEIK